MEQKKYRKGHVSFRWMGIGILLSAAGILLVVITDDMLLLFLSPVMGMLVGLVGSAIEKRKVTEGLIYYSPVFDESSHLIKLILILIFGFMILFIVFFMRGL